MSSHRLGIVKGHKKGASRKPGPERQCKGRRKIDLVGDSHGRQCFNRIKSVVEHHCYGGKIHDLKGRLK